MFDITGQHIGTFDNPTPEAGDVFGREVAASGNYLLVSAWEDDEGGTDAGAAYLFDISTGARLHTFLNPSPHELDHFGSSLSFVDGFVAIGARNDDSLATDCGVVYLFDPISGDLIDALAEPTPLDGALFGQALTAVGETLWVTAVHGSSDAGGAAYAFPVPETAVTDAQGNYTFPGLDAGSYEVRQIISDGHVQTAPGGDGTYAVVLAAGQDLTRLDFGNSPPPLAQDDFESGNFSGGDYQWDSGSWTVSGDASI